MHGRRGRNVLKTGPDMNTTSSSMAFERERGLQQGDPFSRASNAPWYR